MIQAEYLRFLRTLNTDEVHADVRKLANLVLANLDNLVPLSTHQGQRVRQIGALAQSNWDVISAEIQPLPEQVAEQTSLITQLKSLSVGPFRGFMRQEVFDLGSRLVLIYGPNGTGKSSFCEALEYGLLGNVVEAESKRFRDQREYLKNAHVNRFTAPEIIGENKQGENIPIEASEALYRFCFVEKNRIDSFSRIAAQAPAKQTELISTLFGLDSFNEFVRNFSAEIDAKYIDLTGVKAADLVQKRQALSGAHQQTATNTQELQRLDIEEQTLASQYREGSIFSQMIIELNGHEQIPGTIQQLETELQQPPATKLGLTETTLHRLGEEVYNGFTELDATRKELGNASQQVSFKNLYDAVTQVKLNSLEHCPACKTPLNQVAINPYTHASEELQNLQHLAVLQQTVQKLEQSINKSLLTLTQLVSACCNRLTPNPLTHYQLAPNVQANVDWWNSLHQTKQDDYTAWQHLEVQIKQLENADKVLEQAAQVRLIKQTELDRLREFSRQITVLQTQRNTAQQAITAAQEAVANFDTANAQLIADAEAEKAVVLKNQSIAASYRGFVARLNAYKDRLPGQLVANLGDIVVTFYNAFNRNDAPGDLLATVKLPLAQNQRLEIAFQSNRQQFFDALHVLSEGHVRCIGLAILLAKNLKESCPFLIFDDPVNAIDDDHRESIRRTLFEDHYFVEKQIILTCHGEEFFKDIQNLLPAQTAGQSRTFSFLPKIDDAHIRIDFNSAPRNYIIAAQAHLGRMEIRDALTKSRQALEALTKGKVWRYVHRYGNGNLSIKLKAADASIELRNLTEQLKFKVAKSDFSDPNKILVLTPLESILQVGRNGDSREWRYLNKGVHEEDNRTEFDRGVVHEIVSELEKLDEALAV